MPWQRRVGGAGHTSPVDRSALRLHLGRAAEAAALEHYRRRGYRPLARNWRCPRGEIDLVLAGAGVLVFCEVKARRGGDYGGPHDAVTWRKQRRLRVLARACLEERPGAFDGLRFDVASVTVGPGGRLRVHVFEDAF